jgi:hypothetical protein
MDDKQLKEIEKINQLTHVEMARLYRFSPLGHPWFDQYQPFYEVFIKRFKELGGMTPEISKKIGWKQ